MVHPAPRMTKAPVKKRAVVLMTADGAAIGVAIVAAMNVLKRHGKNR
jgi:predicted phosphoribosyltransferase